MKLGLRGARNLDPGEETLDDAALAALLRRRALKIQIQAVALALLPTALLVLLPA